MIASPVMRNSDDTRTFVDVLLEDQRALTAVDRFSRLHDVNGFDLRERQYRSLLPATAPAPGQQYAFEVDLDKCSGCKACVTACHSLNGLEETETWRSVGLLIGSATAESRNPKIERSPKPEDRTSEFDNRNAFGLRTLAIGVQQHLTTACHHCVDPGCLNGCPVLAYDKDPVTGIVRHLDDQCIGCQYCVMKCPYDVPKYSKRLGIVRKCDLCANRLSVGEAPACVQACPNEAIRIALVEREEFRLSYRGEKSETRIPKTERNPKSGFRKPAADNADSAFGHRISFGSRPTDFGFPSASPAPSITLPTTRYLSTRGALSDLQPADAHELRLSRAHWPLSVMLVLTQMAIGAVCVALFASLHTVWLAGSAIGAAALGMMAATFHLGQPLKAWRGFLGWRTSWMSRELIAFGAMMPSLGGYVLTLNPKLAVLAAATGLVAVFCSAMIYVDTQRAFWSSAITFPKFGLTALLLGSALAWVASAIAGQSNLLPAFALALFIASQLKLGGELVLVVLHARAIHSPLRKTALLHVGLAGHWFKARLLCGVVGGALMPLAAVTGLIAPLTSAAVASLLLCLAGEIIERHLFFICESSLRMPGGIAA